MKNASKTHLATERETTPAVAMPQPLQTYLQATLAQIDTVANDEESLWQVGQRGLQMEMAGRIIAGRAFLELCERSHNISEELGRRRIARRTFYDAIDVYRLYAELPDAESVRALAHVGQTKAIAIARWPREEAIALAHGQMVRGITLEDAIELPTRDFMQAVKPPELAQAERKIRELELDRDAANAELREMRDAMRHRYDVLKIPPDAARARQETVALCEQIALSVTSLESLAGELASGELHMHFPDWAERAAGTLYHSLLSQHARIQTMLDRLAEQWGQKVTGRLEYEFTLSEGEAAVARDALAIITQRHRVAQDNRDAERANAAGGRGRPRKIKTVS